MATSGTFTGGRPGTGPWLQLHWSRIAVDVPGNRSQIRLTLTLHSQYALYFSASKSGNLHGSSFTYTGGFSGTGSRTVRTRDVWVSHDSDGSKTQSFSASLNLNIDWTGYGTIGSLSVSGNASIDTIPRASDFTAFSLANSTLNTSTSTTINYTLGRKDSSFSHLMTLRLGSTTIASWTDNSTGSRTRTLSASEVNNIINRMPTSTSGTLTLIMQTRSGSTNIGSSSSRTTSISLNSGIRPSASGLTVSIAGSGRDKTINQYVQGISRVTASFTRSAGYGASISASSINIKRQSNGGNSQTIGSNSGTTPNPLTSSGTYVITGEVKDSRGRTATVTTTITVQAYSVPTISRFTARRITPSTTIEYGVGATWSALGTSNPTTVQVTGQPRGGTKATNYTLSNSTAGSVSTTRTATLQSDATSFTYALTVTDSFGNRASAEVQVGTSFVELTISKGLGIGIGKVHERGALDVKGDVFVEGSIWLNNILKIDAATSIRLGQGAGLDAQIGGNSGAGRNFLYLRSEGGTFSGGATLNLYGASDSSNPNSAILYTGGSATTTFQADGFVRFHKGIQTGQMINPNSNILYLGANQEVRIVEPSNTSSYSQIAAATFRNTSSILYKQNVEEFNEDALSMILDIKPQMYHLNRNIDNGVFDKPKVGFISQMAHPLMRDEDGIDNYSVSSILWRGVQQHHEMILTDREEVARLKERIIDLEYLVSELMTAS